MRKTVRIL